MVHVHIHSSCIERKGRPSTEKHAFTFLYDRQQLPVQCEVEVGGDYYYIGPQRAGLPPNLKLKSGVIARGVGTEVPGFLLVFFSFSCFFSQLKTISKL